MISFYSEHPIPRGFITPSEVSFVAIFLPSPVQAGVKDVVTGSAGYLLRKVFGAPSPAVWLLPKPRR